MANTPVRTDLERLDDRIDIVYQLLLDARRAYEHSPNPHREQDVEDVEAELNRLLDGRLRMQAAEKMVKA